MNRLVLGVGNPFRGDDGAGPAVIAELRRLAPAGLDLATLQGHAAELLETWSAADDVAVIDAARSGAAPGTVHRFDAAREPLPAIFDLGSTHGLGVAEAVGLARALGKLPRRLAVYAIEGRDFTPGAAMSPEVARAARELAGRLAAASSPDAARAAA